MSAKIDLSWSVAGNVRVYVGKECFAKWYRVHTPLHLVLQEAFKSPQLQALGLLPHTATILRIEPVSGLVEVEPPPQ